MSESNGKSRSETFWRRGALQNVAPPKGFRTVSLLFLLQSRHRQIVVKYKVHSGMHLEGKNNYERP